MSRDLPQESLRAAQALHTANRIVNVFRAGDDRTLEEGIRIAAEFLGAKNGDSQHEITALGHCHIGEFMPFHDERLNMYKNDGWSNLCVASSPRQTPLGYGRSMKLLERLVAVGPHRSIWWTDIPITPSFVHKLSNMNGWRTIIQSYGIESAKRWQLDNSIPLEV